MQLLTAHKTKYHFSQTLILLLPARPPQQAQDAERPPLAQAWQKRRKRRSTLALRADFFTLYVPHHRTLGPHALVVLVLSI